MDAHWVQSYLAYFINTASSACSHGICVGMICMADGYSATSTILTVARCS